ncbi:MAG: PhnM protein [Hyphomonadaceae bacterium]|nr:MAG: PhnM protein [Hyphomonadaceae bacterium]
MIRAGTNDDDFHSMLEERTAWRNQEAAPKNRQTIVALAKEYGIALMSHDDESVEHVEESHSDGCIASEFPVSLIAAQKAHEYGMLNVMGAPNFVRGSSHSGNLSARECAELGLLDIISSDYIPLSMLRAAFMLSEAPFNWPMPKAIATVAGNPARLCGLIDRGEIMVGQRADLVQVHIAKNGWPVPRAIWRQGLRVA